MKPEEILKTKPQIEYAPKCGPGSGTRYVKFEDALDAMNEFEIENLERIKQLEIKLDDAHQLLNGLYH